MHIDYIIGNPPYQEDTDGAGRQAKPIYQHFINAARKLNPESIVLITPSRWFSGGMGLDSFRQQMLSSHKISRILDYTNAKDCFPGTSISGGVNVVVLVDRDVPECNFTNITNGQEDTMMRPLDEFPVLIRYNKAVAIIHKVVKKSDVQFDTIVGPLMPYGLSTSYRGHKDQNDGDLRLYSSSDITFISPSEIKKGIDTVNTYRVMVSKTSAEHAGEPDKNGMFRVIPSSMRVICPGDVCTHSYFVIGNWDEKVFADNALRYLKTKFVRFFVLMCLNGYCLSKTVFPFVPMQNFSLSSDIDWTVSFSDIDQQLYKKYGLDQSEIDFIESHVKEMT